jgi:hypothetical protein
MSTKYFVHKIPYTILGRGDQMPHHNEFYLYQISYPPLDNMTMAKSMSTGEGVVTPKLIGAF